MVKDIVYRTELPKEEDLFHFYEVLCWNNFLKLPSNDLMMAIKNSYRSIYAYTDNKLIGTGRVVSDGIIIAYICGLGVLPDYRNQGIGSELLRMLKEHCKEQKLHVQIFCEENLISYYSKMGFTKFAVGMRL